ncbi:ATPase [Pseudomonas fluorescens]|uniref:ATPase n=1 Tax=Pseudomonas fluorescens TaxID=294 RepID=UPI001783A4A1|nr:ATPase [Pseudomonas fluorescens]MBD8190142.1 ATPase [Pseudomonas fluorescens]MBD8224768.1 ATPase [Pseudomonas fluorescens]MBD8783774.1 ATPase [Pseudomonas fluorescens]MBD8815313.1 ATPase [Pseudomonas fluorescens]
MRTMIQLGLMILMLATVAVNNAAIGGELRTGHLLPIVGSVNSLQHAQSVGVLLSDNTRDNLSYLERYHDMALNGAKDALDGRIRQAFVNSSDPELAIDWLMSSLQGTFLSVTVYDNLDALVQAHPDVVVMLDTHNQLLTQRNDQVEARFIARFYDADLQYIAKAEGAVHRQVPSVWVRNKAAPEIAAQIEQQRDVQLDALKQFDASLKALVRAS